MRFKPNRDLSQPDSATSLQVSVAIAQSGVGEVLTAPSRRPRRPTRRRIPPKRRHGVLQGRALKRAILFTRRLLATVAIRGCIARGTAAAIRDESRDGATPSPSAAYTMAGLGAVE